MKQPEVSVHLLDIAEDLRRRLMRTGIILIVLTAAAFPLSETVLRWFQTRTSAPLAAFGIPDAFLALVTIALGMGGISVLPHAFWEVLSALAEVFPAMTRRSRWVFWSVAMGLFFAGVWFCVRITLPYGSRFLLSYESEVLQPVIGVRQFVSFCLLLTLGFGILFELPLVMTLLAWLKVTTAAMVGRYRRYAIVLITIVAAVVTPTPDLVNLLLLAIPLYLLFELGILGMRLCERGKQTASAMGSNPPKV